jgi:hypothetical protein
MSTCTLYLSDSSHASLSESTKKTKSASNPSPTAGAGFQTSLSLTALGIQDWENKKFWAGVQRHLCSETVEDVLPNDGQPGLTGVDPELRDDGSFMLLICSNFVRERSFQGYTPAMYFSLSPFFSLPPSS